MIKESIVGFWHILRAMGVTLRYYFTKPITVQYPDEKVELYPRFRGRHELLRYEDGPNQGTERCIGCALCAAYCPTHCIYVQAGENKDGVQRSPGERYAAIYEINLLALYVLRLLRGSLPHRGHRAPPRICPGRL